MHGLTMAQKHEAWYELFQQNCLKGGNRKKKNPNWEFFSVVSLESTGNLERLVFINKNKCNVLQSSQEPRVKPSEEHFRTYYSNVRGMILL